MRRLISALVALVAIGGLWPNNQERSEGQRQQQQLSPISSLFPVITMVGANQQQRLAPAGMEPREAHGPRRKHLGIQGSSAAWYNQAQDSDSSSNSADHDEEESIVINSVHSNHRQQQPSPPRRHPSSATFKRPPVAGSGHQRQQTNWPPALLTGHSSQQHPASQQLSSNNHNSSSPWQSSNQEAPAGPRGPMSTEPSAPHASGNILQQPSQDFDSMSPRGSNSAPARWTPPTKAQSSRPQQWHQHFQAQLQSAATMRDNVYLANGIGASTAPYAIAPSAQQHHQQGQQQQQVWPQTQAQSSSHNKTISWHEQQQASQVTAGSLIRDTSELEQANVIADSAPADQSQSQQQSATTTATLWMQSVRDNHNGPLRSRFNLTSLLGAQPRPSEGGAGGQSFVVPVGGNAHLFDGHMRAKAGPLTRPMSPRVPYESQTWVAKAARSTPPATVDCSRQPATLVPAPAEGSSVGGADGNLSARRNSKFTRHALESTTPISSVSEQPATPAIGQNMAADEASTGSDHTAALNETDLALLGQKFDIDAAQQGAATSVELANEGGSKTMTSGDAILLGNNHSSGRGKQRAKPADGPQIQQRSPPIGLQSAKTGRQLALSSAFETETTGDSRTGASSSRTVASNESGHFDGESRQQERQLHSQAKLNQQTGSGAQVSAGFLPRTWPRLLPALLQRTLGGVVRRLTAAANQQQQLQMFHLQVNGAQQAAGETLDAAALPTIQHHQHQPKQQQQKQPSSARFGGFIAAALSGQRPASKHAQQQLAANQFESEAVGDKQQIGGHFADYVAMATSIGGSDPPRQHANKKIIDSAIDLPASERRADSAAEPAESSLLKGSLRAEPRSVEVGAVEPSDHSPRRLTETRARKGKRISETSAGWKSADAAAAAADDDAELAAGGQQSGEQPVATEATSAVDEMAESGDGDVTSGSDALEYRTTTAPDLDDPEGVADDTRHEAEPAGGDEGELMEAADSQQLFYSAHEALGANVAASQPRDDGDSQETPLAATSSSNTDAAEDQVDEPPGEEQRVGRPAYQYTPFPTVSWQPGGRTFSNGKKRQKIPIRRPAVTFIEPLAYEASGDGGGSIGEPFSNFASSRSRQPAAPVSGWRKATGQQGAGNLGNIRQPHRPQQQLEMQVSSSGAGNRRRPALLFPVPPVGLHVARPLVSRPPAPTAGGNSEPKPVSVFAAPNVQSDSDGSAGGDNGMMAPMSSSINVIDLDPSMTRLAHNKLIVAKFKPKRHRLKNGGGSLKSPLHSIGMAATLDSRQSATSTTTTSTTTTSRRPTLGSNGDLAAAPGGQSRTRNGNGQSLAGQGVASAILGHQIITNNHINDILSRWTRRPAATTTTNKPLRIVADLAGGFSSLSARLSAFAPKLSQPPTPSTGSADVASASPIPAEGSSDRPPTSTPPSSLEAAASSSSSADPYTPGQDEKKAEETEVHPTTASVGSGSEQQQQRQPPSTTVAPQSSTTRTPYVGNRHEKFNFSLITMNNRERVNPLLFPIESNQRGSTVNNSNSGSGNSLMKNKPSSSNSNPRHRFSSSTTTLRPKTTPTQKASFTSSSGPNQHQPGVAATAHNLRQHQLLLQQQQQQMRLQNKTLHANQHQSVAMMRSTTSTTTTTTTRSPVLRATSAAASLSSAPDNEPIGQIIRNQHHTRPNTRRPLTEAERLRNQYLSLIGKNLTLDGRIRADSAPTVPAAWANNDEHLSGHITLVTSNLLSGDESIGFGPMPSKEALVAEEGTRDANKYLASSLAGASSSALSVGSNDDLDASNEADSDHSIVVISDNHHQAYQRPAHSQAPSSRPFGAMWYSGLGSFDQQHPTTTAPTTTLSPQASATAQLANRYLEELVNGSRVRPSSAVKLATANSTTAKPFRQQQPAQLASLSFSNSRPPKSDDLRPLSPESLGGSGAAGGNDPPAFKSSNGSPSSDETIGGGPQQAGQLDDKAQELLFDLFDRDPSYSSSFFASLPASNSNQRQHFAHKQSAVAQDFGVLTHYTLADNLLADSTTTTPPSTTTTTRATPATSSSELDTTAVAGDIVTSAMSLDEQRSLAEQVLMASTLTPSNVGGERHGADYSTATSMLSNSSTPMTTPTTTTVPPAPGQGRPTDTEIRDAQPTKAPAPLTLEDGRSDMSSSLNTRVSMKRNQAKIQLILAAIAKLNSTTTTTKNPSASSDDSQETSSSLSSSSSPHYPGPTPPTQASGGGGATSNSNGGSDSEEPSRFRRPANRPTLAPPFIRDHQPYYLANVETLSANRQKINKPSSSSSFDYSPHYQPMATQSPALEPTTRPKRKRLTTTSTTTTTMTPFQSAAMDRETIQYETGRPPITVGTAGDVDHQLIGGGGEKQNLASISSSDYSSSVSNDEYNGYPIANKPAKPTLKRRKPRPPSIRPPQISWTSQQQFLPNRIILGLAHSSSSGAAGRPTTTNTGGVNSLDVDGDSSAGSSADSARQPVRRRKPSSKRPAITSNLKPISVSSAYDSGANANVSISVSSQQDDSVTILFDANNKPIRVGQTHHQSAVYRPHGQHQQQAVVTGGLIRKRPSYVRLPPSNIQIHDHHGDLESNGTNSGSKKRPLLDLSAIDIVLPDSIKRKDHQDIRTRPLTIIDPSIELTNDTLGGLPRQPETTIVHNKMVVTYKPGRPLPGSMQLITTPAGSTTPTSTTRQPGDFSTGNGSGLSATQLGSGNGGDTLLVSIEQQRQEAAAIAAAALSHQNATRNPGLPDGVEKTDSPNFASSTSSRSTESTPTLSQERPATTTFAPSIPHRPIVVISGLFDATNQQQHSSSSHQYEHSGGSSRPPPTPHKAQRPSSNSILEAGSLSVVAQASHGYPNNSSRPWYPTSGSSSSSPFAPSSSNSSSSSGQANQERHNSTGVVGVSDSHHDLAASSSNQTADYVVGPDLPSLGGVGGGVSSLFRPGASQSNHNQQQQYLGMPFLGSPPGSRPGSVGNQQRPNRWRVRRRPGNSTSSSSSSWGSSTGAFIGSAGYYQPQASTSHTIFATNPYQSLLFSWLHRLFSWPGWVKIYENFAVLFARFRTFVISLMVMFLPPLALAASVANVMSS